MVSLISAERAKFFTHQWSITIPQRPSVRYVRLTLPRLDEWLDMVTNPNNRPHDKTLRSKVSDPAAMEALRVSLIHRHTSTLTKFDALTMLIEVDGQLVGGANYSPLQTGDMNMGMILKENARGQGLGKLTQQVLIQLGQRIFTRRLTAGTMKSNQRMQAIMASLNIPGRDEIQEAPGRGVVGEILYVVPETVHWELDLQVEFGGPVPEEV